RRGPDDLAAEIQKHVFEEKRNRGFVLDHEDTQASEFAAACHGFDHGYLLVFVDARQAPRSPIGVFIALNVMKIRIVLASRRRSAKLSPQSTLATIPTSRAGVGKRS